MTARDVALLLAVLVVAAAVLPTPFDLALVLIAAVALFASAASPAFAAGRADPDDDAAHRRDSGRALPFAGLVAALALLTFASAGLYMVLANYGLVFFTGKNVYLLGLDSVSDALEGLVLLAIGAAGAAWLPAPTAQLHAGRTVALPKRAPRALPRATPVTTP